MNGSNSPHIMRNPVDLASRTMTVGAGVVGLIVFVVFSFM